MSEHHAGFPSYFPQPLLAVNWVLGATARVWSAPAPLLLGLRNPALVAEEAAWAAARFPGRVGLAIAPGYSEADFDAIGERHVTRLEDFVQKSEQLVRALRGEGPLAEDAAIRAIAQDQRRLPVVFAANSRVRVRRAAQIGAGVIFPGSEEPARLRELTEVYRDAGGTAATICIRSVWVASAGAGAGGGSHRDGADELSRAYLAAAAPGMRQASGFRSGPIEGDAGEVVERLLAFVEASGVGAVNLRCNRAGAAPEAVAEQIAVVGEAVLPSLRDVLRKTLGSDR